MPISHLVLGVIRSHGVLAPLQHYTPMVFHARSAPTTRVQCRCCARTLSSTRPFRWTISKLLRNVGLAKPSSTGLSFGGPMVRCLIDRRVSICIPTKSSSYSTRLVVTPKSGRKSKYFPSEIPSRLYPQRANAQLKTHANPDSTKIGSDATTANAERVSPI
jgi:predicted alpha/beta-fold hydrolase